MSLGWILQRASARRRSAPSPEHGASSRTAVNEPGENGGATPSATTTGRSSPSVRTLSATSRGTANTLVVGDHRRTPGRHRRRLAAGGGAHVEHQLTLARLDRRGDPLRRLVLHVAVGAHGDRRGLIHPFERLHCVVSEFGPEHLDDPVRIAEPSAVGRPRHVVHGQPCHLAQHRVDEAAGALRCQPDGLAHRGVRRDAGEHELVRTEAEHRSRGVVGRRCDEAVDDGVACSSHPCGSVDQLGDEPPIHVTQARRCEHRAEHQVRVRTVGLDTSQGVERDTPCGPRRGFSGACHKSPNSSSGFG